LPPILTKPAAILASILTKPGVLAKVFAPILASKLATILPFAFIFVFAAVFAFAILSSTRVNPTVTTCDSQTVFGIVAINCEGDL